MITFPRLDSPSIVTLGNFDGVHKGHQSLLQEVKRLASANGARSVALFFYPHPLQVVHGKEVEELTSPQVRINLLKSYGIDIASELLFDQETSTMSAEKFLKILKQHVNMQTLVIGPTTHIGHKREGTPQKIAELGVTLGFGVKIVPENLMDNEIVSSSRIRDYIRQGKVKKAAAMLGRAHITEGKIKKDRGLGTQLGFPTLNLAPISTLLPRHGVYLTQSKIQDTLYWGLTNVGTRPTVSTSTGAVTHVETHLLDIKELIPPESMAIHWMDRLRDEKKFAHVQALIEQITLDVQRAKALLLK